MSSHLIIVDKSSSFKFDRTDLEVLTTKDYIARPELVRTRNPKIVNLSRAYSYLGAGYYCSPRDLVQHNSSDIVRCRR